VAVRTATAAPAGTERTAPSRANRGTCEDPYGTDYYHNYLDGADAWERALAARAFVYRALLRAARRHLPAPADVVEVGCGTGFMSALLAELEGHPQVVGGDRSAAAVQIARAARAGHANLRLCRADALALPYRDVSADLVVCLDVVEHLATPQAFFAEARRVLRPGGALLFSTPNPASLGARLKGSRPPATGRPQAERTREWFGRRDDSHVSVYPIARWRALAAEAGLVRLADGTDFWWDTPYVDRVPLVLQKLVFNGSFHVLFRLFGFVPWRWGENYYGLWQRP
jgi:SAM-dependent methyltransferase